MNSNLWIGLIFGVLLANAGLLAAAFWFSRAIKDTDGQIETPRAKFYRRAYAQLNEMI